MKNLYKGRLIKPTNGSIRILLKLRKVSKTVPVYDSSIPSENLDFSVIHNTLWELQKLGHIEYGRCQGELGNTMCAKITFAGKRWLIAQTIMIIFGMASVLACIFSCIALF
jgi:hypothetical protein